MKVFLKNGLFQIIYNSCKKFHLNESNNRGKRAGIIFCIKLENSVIFIIYESNIVQCMYFPLRKPIIDIGVLLEFAGPCFNSCYKLYVYIQI